MKKLLLSKFKEAALSVLPIIIIVAILNFTVAPMSLYNMMLFLISAFVMILGIALFNLGVDISLMPIGENIGAALVKSKNLIFIIFLTFLIGVFVTVAEPDLFVLAGQINGVPDAFIIMAVALGVGLALILAFLRILFQIKLSYILMACYAIAFILSAFTEKNFLSIAFESGAVTTGPIMVPFIMALGLGLASVRGDKTSEEDSFGLISLCLIGPIITVMILGMFFNPTGGSALTLPEINSISNIIRLFLINIPEYMRQVALALFPMLLLFSIYQVTKLHLSKKNILRITIGTIYTFVGLVLFLLSVNIGFMPAGYLLGNTLVQNIPTWVLVLIGLIMGYFVVAAEPAVFVLKEQVEEVTEGSISAKAMGLGLSLGVGVSVALSMIRVITGISILYFVIPGYLIALILTFIVPPLFTSIAFDSGAVASGPLAATFLLPFAIGASEALGGNIYSDAFGIVALIAMTPVITLQLFGLTYVIKLRKIQNQNPLPVGDDNIIYYDDEDIEEDVSSDNVEERVDVNDINRYNSTKDDAHTKNIEAEV
ncbi:DUF1538 domain-containing protein [Herbinix luporum]|jgi:hypothetical protein|uniref:DUF1538 domain-containing protein n=1 Tax=Herbinix luporum TaxID=1679721 RepID=UPI0017773EAD|nr:DUF1538 domain-containing protein [Herbinix luporum]HHT57513.1 DUF1538 domain-containing protein [Herbinix luporum]